MALAFLDRRPTAAATLGALGIAFSAILFRAAHVSPSTGAFYRCAFAVPFLLAAGTLEDRALGQRTRRERLLAAAAGLFFAADLEVWNHAVDSVGAGLGTVLGNTQVVLVALTACCFSASARRATRSQRSRWCSAASCSSRAS